MSRGRWTTGALLALALLGCDDDAAGTASDASPEVDAAAEVDATPAIDAASEVDATPAVDAALEVDAAPPPAEIPYDRLSEYGFFTGPLAELNPAERVFPYQVAAPLWADHAGKARYIALPPGGAAQVEGDEDWRMPEGTIVIKNFWYSTDRRDMEGTAKIIETRLLVREGDEWTSHVYLWDDAQTDAERIVAGARVQLGFVDEAGADAEQEYIVPNTNQCGSCHENDDVAQLLGVVSRQMQRTVERDGGPVDQLAWLAEQGLFVDGAPTPDVEPLADPFGDAPLERRARSYLDANCSHCHRPGGDGGSSGLVLLASETTPAAYGICKSPVAAGPGAGGRRHDIVPGRPDESIMVFRMESTDPEIKMPEIPNRLADEQGVALIRAWIEGMEPPGCD